MQENCFHKNYDDYKQTTYLRQTVACCGTLSGFMNPKMVIFVAVDEGVNEGANKTKRFGPGVKVLNEIYINTVKTDVGKEKKYWNLSDVHCTNNTQYSEDVLFFSFSQTEVLDDALYLLKVFLAVRFYTLARVLWVKMTVHL